MNITVEDAGPCRKVIRIKAAAADMASDYNNLLKSYASSVSVPGFRKGKAPVEVVERKYAKRIADDAKEQLVPRIYRKAVDQEGLKPVAVVDVKDVLFDKEAGLDFNVIIDVAPDFKLPKYKKVPVKVEPVIVEEKAIVDAIESLRERFARFENTERTDIQAEDLVEIDYHGSMDGAPLQEFVPEKAKGIGEGADFWLHVGDPEFLPGFNAGLIGRKTGETQSIEVSFPEDFAISELAGRSATYRVSPKAIRERVLPELNEEFAKQLELDSIDALKARMRENLEGQAREAEKNRQRSEVSQWLMEKTTLDLPQSVVEEETRMTARNIVDNVVRSGATREQIVAQQQVILETASKASMERVKLNYILGKIAEEEKLEVSGEEISENIVSMAARYGMTPDELRSRIVENNGLDRLSADILADKTLDFLLESAKSK